jgi:uncharacterized protein with HEPN domain
MSPDDVYLLDILDSARLVLGYVKGKNADAFRQDFLLQDSVIRRLAVIGEAARRISKDTRYRLPHIAWPTMIAMRNVMVHEYDEIDLTIVWDTVHEDLPRLVAELEKIVPPPS